MTTNLTRLDDKNSGQVFFSESAFCRHLGLWCRDSMKKFWPSLFSDLAKTPSGDRWNYESVTMTTNLTRLDDKNSGQVFFQNRRFSAIFDCDVRSHVIEWKNSDQVFFRIWLNVQAAIGGTTTRLPWQPIWRSKNSGQVFFQNRRFSVILDCDVVTAWKNSDQVFSRIWPNVQAEIGGTTNEARFCIVTEHPLA